MTGAEPPIDVVIAGAGMVGATLALGLARGGLKVVLIDPAPFEVQTAPTYDGRASAISLAAFRQWRALGAEPFLAPHALPIRQILVTDGRSPGASARPAGGAFLRFDPAEIAGAQGDEPLGFMIENRHIRAGLARAIEAAGIEVLAPARVVSATAGVGAVAVGLEDGRTISAPLLVAADGKGSRVRRLAGIDTFGWGYRQVGVVATVACERDHQGVAYEHFLPAGPFAILPLTGRRASLVWTEKRRTAAALEQARGEIFEAHLRRRFGPFLGAVKVQGPRFFHPLFLQLAHQATAARTVLVGDAAHSIHPIAGQGLNMGLKDVAALAQVLTQAVRLGEDLGGPLVLERYARWRSLDNVGVALATDLFNRLFSNDAPALRLGRDLAMRAVNGFGPARRLFMREAGGTLGDLPPLLRGEAPGA